MSFLAMMIAAMVSPLGLVGWIIAGAVARELKNALLLALIFAVLLSAFGTLFPAGLTIWEALPSRIAGGVAATTIVYVIAFLVRRRRATRKAASV